MKEASPINRTFYPKFVTYTGDGNGRDCYVVFNNGGLHPLRDYQGPRFNSFNCSSKLVNSRAPTPFKESTAFDYKPDGTGRDLYIIR